MAQVLHATPCPSLNAYAGSAEQDANTVQMMMRCNADDDTTWTIARTIREEFHNAKPMRRSTLAQKPKRNTVVNIFEDHTAHCGNEDVSRLGGDARSERRSTILQQPARRVRLQTLPATRAPQHHEDREYVQSPEKPNLETHEDHRQQDETTLLHPTIGVESSAFAKKPRRRTIWVPSEDTTILTIHPGAHKHALEDETLYISRRQQAGSDRIESDLCSNMTAITDVRQPPSTAPKRVPFCDIVGTRANIATGDIAGSGPGKENQPPHHSQISMKKAAVLLKTVPRQSGPQPIPPQDRPVRPSKFWQPTATSQARQTLLENGKPTKGRHIALKKSLVSAPPRYMEGSGSSQQQTSKSAPMRQTLMARAALPSTLPHTVSGSSITYNSSTSKPLTHYPVLQDDLNRSELYEENWLLHQEVSLTQLINGMFDQGSNDISNEALNINLRSGMLHLYHETASVAAHKRLQASLQFGALSLPQGSSPPRMREDIAIRRQYLSLWLDTYKFEALQAAAEVVIGRGSLAVPSRTGTNSSSLHTDDQTGSKKRRALERFLTTFLVDNEDHTPDQALGMTNEHSLSAHLWHKTVLRSLMLLFLLDHSKQRGCISGCIFKIESPHKSSSSVLRALGSILLPSIGDVTRTLRYLDYKLDVIQHPLEEYTYRMETLSVDMRDGIRLTRLVELLLCRQNGTCQRDSAQTGTLSVQHTLGSLPSRREQGSLSQSLKYPCHSRAQKLHNVEVALGALTGVGGIPSAATLGIKAEDIVDGHREKTLSVLWALVSQWGLSLLVNEQELLREITRLTGDNIQTSGDCADHDGTERIVSLLKAWARALCQPRNVQVNNLTTSFADGRALSAIVDAYTSYLPMRPTATNALTTSFSNRSTLAQQLKSLGCNTAFTNLFTNQVTRIPSRETSISLLAFLASRLIPLSREHRAVCTLQRAYRLRLARMDITKRVVLAKLARDCATIIQARERVLMAAVVLQRAWRAVLDWRIEALERDVMAFQTMARGWAKRRVLGKGRTDAGRVRGGW